MQPPARSRSRSAAPGVAGLASTSTSQPFGSVTVGSKAVKTFNRINHQTQSVTLSESFSGTKRK
jgi:hypothetical protein